MGQLEEYIARCDAVLADGTDGDAWCDLVNEIRTVYHKEAKGHGLYSAFEDYELQAVRAWLVKIKEQQARELAIAKASSPSVSATAIASVDATFNLTMSQMWALPGAVLTTDQKQELAKLLQAVEDSGKDEGKLRKAGKAVADWAFDHAIKAVPTVMPYVTQAVQGLVG